MVYLGRVIFSARFHGNEQGEVSEYSEQLELLRGSSTPRVSRQGRGFPVNAAIFQVSLDFAERFRGLSFVSTHTSPSPLASSL